MTDTPEITAIRAAMRLFESASNTTEIEDALDAFELASGPEEMARLIKHIDAQHAEIARLKAEVTRPESTEMTLMRTLAQSRGEEIERLRADADQMLETLTGIRNANPREWEELSCEFTEFERWAKARANHSILKNAAMKEAP